MTPIEQAAQALRNVVAVYDNGTAGYLVDDAINKARAALASLEAAKQEPLTDEQITEWAESFIRQVAFNRPIAIQIAVEAAKWVRSKLAAAPSPGSGT